MTHVKITSLGPCEDKSDKCDEFAQYCGKNNYVAKRCLKTCGICSKFIITHNKTLNIIEVKRNIVLYP